MTHSEQSASRFLKRSKLRPVAARARQGGRPAAIESLEGRTLFALTIGPFAASSPAITLANQLLLAGGAGTGINITGASFVGVDGQAGTYAGFDLSSGNNRLAISDGVILTSGSAQGALGPNDNFPDNFGLADESTSVGTPGDADLDALVGTGTNDANALIVNFTVDPGVQSILFDFVFGSEEFPEFVGAFNDAFGAYLDGQQVSFDTDGRAITVNNNFFQLNNSGLSAADDPDVAGKIGVTLDIEYDGLTRVIRTQAPLNAGIVTHTLKFVIADAVDTVLDSGVFISRLQGSTQAVSGPITDLPQPGIFNFSPSSYTIDETGLFLTATIIRENGSSGLVTVDLFTSDGSATANQDYTPFPLTTLTFVDGQTSQTVTIPILDDPIAEGNENFTLQLANPTNAAGLGLNAQANVLIVDNELGVQFGQTDFIVSEGTSTVTANITVVLTGPSPVPVTVDYATTSGGSATPGEDYGPVAGTLTFAPGQTTQTFTVEIFDDFIVEGESLTSGNQTVVAETVILTLSNASLPVILGLANPARLLIADLERPPAVLDAQFVTNERFINGVALRFSEAMTEANVEDLRNYDIFLRKESRKFGGSPTRKRFEIVSAVYEPTSRTITLTTKKRLQENKVFEVVVNTTRLAGVESVLGEQLDGNYDNTAGDDFTGYLSRATRISYFDRHGDRVSLRLKGPGKMELFRDVERDARLLRMIDTSQDTILTGTVQPQVANITDSLATIDTILTGTGFRNRLEMPPFQIGQTIDGFQIPNT